MYENMSKRVLDKIHEVVKAWELTFDAPPPKFMEFTSSTFGYLNLNGIELGHVSDVVIESMVIQSNSRFCISFADGYEVRVGIEWSYNASPQVSYIEKANYLYIAP